MNYEGDLRQLQGQDKFKFKTINQISIPTIFGSGAELTPSAVFINENTKVKGGINSELIRSKIAILDPDIAKSDNFEKLAECSFDALVHCLESYTSKISNNYTKTMSIMGAKYILKGFLKSLLKGLFKDCLRILKGLFKGVSYLF